MKTRKKNYLIDDEYIMKQLTPTKILINRTKHMSHLKDVYCYEPKHALQFSKYSLHILHQLL